MTDTPLRHENHPTLEATATALVRSHKVPPDPAIAAVTAAQLAPGSWIVVEGTAKRYSVRFSKGKWAIRIRNPNAGQRQ